MGVHASNNENSGSENDDFPHRASKMNDVKHPAKRLFQNKSGADVTMISNEESDEEDYHVVTGANRQLHRQSSQKLNDTIGSHAEPLDPVNQIALAIVKLANKNSPQLA